MSSVLTRPDIFAQFPGVAAGLSRRDPSRAGGFSMLYAATDAELAANRAALVEALGFDAGHLAFPKLEHGTRVVELADNFSLEQRPVADAMITDKPGWLVGVAVADCVAVLLYDPAHQAVAAVHSGWRGSAANVVGAAVSAMAARYDTNPRELYAYVSPAPTRNEYEVEAAVVADKFAPQYSTPGEGGKAWFDNQAVVRDQLASAGVPAPQIEVDRRSTIADPQLHSYRRDGTASGRMLAAIGLLI